MPTLTQVAEAYDALPAETPELGEPAHTAWLQLASYCRTEAKRIGQGLRVSPIAVAEPYDTAEEQAHDMWRNGRLRVSTLNCDHPVWTVEDNVNYRIVHDYIGHSYNADLYAPPFNFYGEMLAWQRQLGSMLANSAPDDVIRAAYVETVAQTCFAAKYGHFGPQKVGFLPFDVLDLVVDDR